MIKTPCGALPYAAKIGAGSSRPSPPRSPMRSGARESEFRVDYSIELDSIPVVSAGDILSGRVQPALLSGKDTTGIESSSIE